MLRKIFFSPKFNQLRDTLISLKNKNDTILREVDTKIVQLKQEREELTNLKNEIYTSQEKLKSIYNDTFSTIEWLADKYADFYFLIEKNNIVYSKRKNSINCSEAQKEFASKNRELRRKNTLLELQLKQIEAVYEDASEIIDLGDEFYDNDDIETEEKINKLVPEQNNRSREEILQEALDTYLYRRKSKYALGKDYERYIGYLYESKGYKVEYHGITKGLDDLGVDLICIKDNEILLIQCKYWNKDSTIRENAISQLFGTSIRYCIENDYNLSDGLFNTKVKPIFITTTNLSETAEKFASLLKIEVINIPFDKNYPKIKCNPGIDKDGKSTKIYHLPFDQMYDRVNNILNGGFNVCTIKEAKKQGYRRAFRWRGN